MEFVRQPQTKTAEQIRSECVQLRTYAGSTYVFGERINLDIRAQEHPLTGIIWYAGIKDNQVLFVSNSVPKAYILIDKLRQGETVTVYEENEYVVASQLERTTEIIDSTDIVLDIVTEPEIIVSDVIVTDVQTPAKPPIKPKRKYTRKPKPTQHVNVEVKQKDSPDV